MTSPRHLLTVDVFTARPLMGNPVAVILDGDGLDTATMQAIASWTNLSETTFVCAASVPGADYHLRIFTPRAELPFAGHPTIGSAAAVLSAGLAQAQDGRLVQQCGVGLIDIAVPDDWTAAGLSFCLPDARISLAPEGGLLAAALGAQPVAPPMIIDVGPRWVIADMGSAAAVDAVVPDLAALAGYDRRHGTTGQTIFGAATGNSATGTDIHVRSFAAADGIAEDPVCGSGNGAAAAYRRHMGQVAAGDAYVAAQGMAVGRDGRVRIRITDDAIHVGGQAVVVAQGELRV